MKGILIVGGGTRNKGAQAMLYTTIYEVKMRFPERRVYVAMHENLYAALDIDATIVACRPLSWTYMLNGKNKIQALVKNAYYLLREFASSILKKKTFPKRKLNKLAAISGIIDDIDIAMDISGFCLSSRINTSLNDIFLDRLEVLKAHGVNTYLLPQSFGPFHYEDNRIPSRISHILTYPKIIFAREQSGAESLKSLGIEDNVRPSCDIVIQNTGIDYNKVLKNNTKPQSISVPEKTVFIIPSMMIASESTSHAEALTIYTSCINAIVERGYHALILWHSGEDASISRDIAKCFNKDANVSLLEHEASSVEFTEAVKKAEFCIASRYHSIIHALKQCTPCIVIGWADKYKEVLNIFDQNGYCFDVSEGLNIENVIIAIDRMIENLQNEKRTIGTALIKCQGDNAFDAIQKLESADCVISKEVDGL